jgi:very-short-patch-repair endonuclease
VQLLARTRGEALSLAEARLHAALRRRGVGGWVANATLRLGGRSVVVDLLFARERVVVEVDGFAAHGTREAFEHDRRRQNALVNAGYVVLRFTWRDLVERESAVVDEIRHALDRRQSS